MARVFPSEFAQLQREYPLFFVKNKDSGDFESMALLGFSERENLLHTGIATGPVVAGVIGTKRFLYDLWGDTVNVASRLTDEAVQDMIQVDRTTYNRIRHDYAFEPPATVYIKGKGEMVMYRLTSRLGNGRHV